LFRRTRKPPPFGAYLLAGALLLGIACSSHDPASRNDSIVAAGEADYAASHRATMPPDSTPVAAKAVAPVALNDASIAALAGEGNRLEIEVARIAVGKASSPAVKLYARQLIDDHARTDRDLRDLEKRLNLAEKPPAQDTTKAELDHLKTRFAALPRRLAFDTAFVHREVEDHVNDLQETKALAAKARNAELKKLLTESLSDQQRHLDRARALSKALVAKK
jgi:putative membrane protein